MGKNIPVDSFLSKARLKPCPTNAALMGNVGQGFSLANKVTHKYVADPSKVI